MGTEKQSEAAPAQEINTIIQTVSSVTQQQTPAAATPVTTTTIVPSSSPTTGQVNRTIKKVTKIKLVVKKEDSYPATVASGAAFKNRPKVYRNPRSLPQGSYGTHRPIGPRGSVVLVSQNPNVDRSKAITHKPDASKLRIRFKDVKGNIHEHDFPGRHVSKWDDDEWISALNKWRYQTFSRKFQHDPSQVRGRRGKWTMAERSFLKEQVIKKIEEYGDRLQGEDWKGIAKAHNARFANTVVKKGEQLLKGVAVKEYIITERSAIAIRATFDKDDELKQMLEDMVAEYTDAEDEDEEDGEPMEGIIKEEHGGDLEHHLEDPSDDEDDGRRPASNHTGAILVEGAC